MKKLSFKMKLYIAIAIIVIVLIISVFIIGKQSGKKDQSDVKLPKDSTWGKSNGITEAESATVTKLAKALYDDMKGLHVFGSRDEATYIAVSQLSDRLLGALYYHFNENYGKGETLTSWIAKESYSWTSFTLAGYTKSISDRLKNLNLL